MIALIFREQDFFKRRAFLLTHPVELMGLEGLLNLLLPKAESFADFGQMGVCISKPYW